MSKKTIWWIYENEYQDKIFVIEAIEVERYGKAVKIISRDPLKEREGLINMGISEKMAYKTREEAEFVLNLSNKKYEVLKM